LVDRPAVGLGLRAREEGCVRNCRLWVAVVCALTVAVVLPSTSPAAAQSERVRVSFVTTEICGADGEPIAVDGELHLVSTFTSTAEGVYFEQQIAQAHLVGVGLVSGDTYIFNATGHTVGNYLPNGGSVSMEADQSVQVHAGESTALDDFYMRFSFTPSGTFVSIEGCR
jgi:hypothetical protein